MTPKKHQRIGFLARNARNLALAETLRMRGFEVHVPEREDRPSPGCDVWIVHVADPVELAAALALRHAQDASIIALVADDRQADRAEELAPIETLNLGPAPDFGALTRAIGHALESISGEVDSNSHGYRRSYPATENGVRRSARDLAAFLTEKEVVQAHRIRIASAMCEVADNVRRHAYPEHEGAFETSVELKRTRVSIKILDGGRGFDAERLHLESVPAALPAKEDDQRNARKNGGIQRVTALSEECRLSSNAKGTYVELYFELTPVRFDEETDEFGEVDYLDPERARELLLALREDGEQLRSISPALALTIGRLLDGAQRGRT